MIFEEDPTPSPPPKDGNDDWARYTIFTVIVAGASALASGLGSWAVDELRERYGDEEEGNEGLLFAGGEGRSLMNDIGSKCHLCDGAAYVCEQPDSTCRFFAQARDFLNDGLSVAANSAVLRLAVLLRKTEDSAWERLSAARTKELDRLRLALRTIADDGCSADDQWSPGCDGKCVRTAESALQPNEGPIT